MYIFKTNVINFCVNTLRSFLSFVCLFTFLRICGCLINLPPPTTPTILLSIRCCSWCWCWCWCCVCVIHVCLPACLSVCLTVCVSVQKTTYKISTFIKKGAAHAPRWGPAGQRAAHQAAGHRRWPLRAAALKRQLDRWWVLHLKNIGSLINNLKTKNKNGLISLKWLYKVPKSMLRKRTPILNLMLHTFKHLHFKTRATSQTNIPWNS